MGTESYNNSLGDSSEIKMYGGVLQYREMSMFGWMKSGDEGWILVRAKGKGQLHNYYQQYWNRGWNTDLLDTVKIFLTEEALYREVKEHEIMERSVADKTTVFVLNKAGSHVDDNGLYHRNSTSIQDVRLSTWMSRYLEKVNKKQIGEDPLKTVDEPKNITEHRKRIEEIHSIYKEKNAKYGNSFDKSLDKYGVVAWQVRNGDKMNRLETLLDDLLVKGDDGTYKLLDTLEGTNESIHDTLMDTAGYIIMLDMWLSSLKENEDFVIYADGKIYDRFKVEDFKEGRVSESKTELTHEEYIELKRERGCGEMNQYQTQAKRTAPVSSSRRKDLANYALGLAGEAGEVGDIIKKHLFHGHPLDREALKDELGDILWYLSNLASSVDISLQDIATHNIKKLYKRYPDGFDSEKSINREV